MTQVGMENLESAMRGYRALQGSGCTFKLLYHVVRGDAVVGYATEPMIGRLPVYTDRSAVCEGM